MKLIDWPKYSWCSAKESSMLSKRIDDAKRKQSIYSEISINCYAVEGNNTGQNIVKSQFFHLGFVKFSLCCLPVSVDLSGATQWSWEVSEKILASLMRLITLMRIPATFQSFIDSAEQKVQGLSFNEGNNPLNSKCYHKYIVANLSEMIRSVSGIRYNRQNNAQKGKEFLIEPNHNMEIYMKKRLHKYP